MKILITGVAGFLGNALAKRLLDLGHDVVGVDNFVTGSFLNISGIKEKFGARFEFLEEDVCGVLKDKVGAVEAVFHLACPASPKDYYGLPLQTMWTSAVGTKNVLDIAAKNDAFFFLASSSEIYGESEKHPLAEGVLGEVDTMGVRACYQEGKRFAESLAMNYQKSYGMPMFIARIFNVYGPGMRLTDGRVVPQFVKAVIENETMVVYGDGTQTRAFCYIEDMVELMVRSLEVKEFVGPVNLGNDEEISIRELAEVVRRVGGSEVKILTLESEFMDMRKRKPDLAKMRSLFGEKEFVSLEEGIKKTLDFYRENRN